MTPKNRKRLVPALGAAAAVALGVTVAVQPAAYAAAAGLSVSPATGLAHGDTVTAEVTGAVPGETYYIAQCADIPAGHACDPSTATSFTVDGNGEASIPLVVSKTFVGTSPEGTSLGSVDCGAVQCYIGAGNAGLDLGDVAISFS